MERGEQDEVYARLPHRFSTQLEMYRIGSVKVRRTCVLLQTSIYLLSCTLLYIEINASNDHKSNVHIILRRRYFP